MTFRQLDLNAIRAAQILTILGFGYLAYRGRQDPFSTDLLVAFHVLPVLPFILAFACLIRGPSASQWIAIRTIHQALAIVAFALLAILLIGLPDTALACVFLALGGAIQLAALTAMKRIAPQLQRWRWQWAFRVGLVLLFTIVFLSFK